MNDYNACTTDAPSRPTTIQSVLGEVQGNVMEIREYVYSIGATLFGETDVERDPDSKPNGMLQELQIAAYKSRKSKEMLIAILNNLRD